MTAMPNKHFGIPSECPGCHTPIAGGAVWQAVEAAEQGKRVLGLMPDVTADDCDAVYVGDLVTNGVLRCPRCGSNCFVEMEPPGPRGDYLCIT